MDKTLKTDISSPVFLEIKPLDGVSLILADYLNISECKKVSLIFYLLIDSRKNSCEIL
jgi:hypothetical protein